MAEPRLMGARNVAGALAMHLDLPHRARLGLVVMALRSLDDPRDGHAARRYFAGPDLIADALGYPRADGQVTDSARRQAEKVLTELVRAGAVTRLRVGGRGRRSEYQVNVDPLEVSADSPTVSVGLQPDRNGRNSPTDSVGIARPNRSASGTKRNHKEKGARRTTARASISPAAIHSRDHDYEMASHELQRFPATEQSECVTLAQAEGLTSAYDYVPRAVEIARERAASERAVRGALA